MRILFAHNHYQQPGGEDRVVAAEMQMLASRGHQVSILSVDNEHIHGAVAKISAAVGSLYSPASAKAFDRHLEAFQPDVVHIHNFSPTLSPAVFFVARRHRVPVVHTLHNYRLICAAATLFRDGKVCLECIENRSFLPGAVHGCYRGSRAGTAVIGANMALHSMLGTWEFRIDRYIVLSQFCLELLTRFRIPIHRVRINPNFTENGEIGPGGGGYALFAGRLAPEKGLAAIIEADRNGGLEIPIYIAGDGPMMSELHVASQRPGSSLRLLGLRDKNQVRSLMQRANVLLVPSIWHEPFGLTVIEAFASGCPVIGTSLGSLPELIPDGIAGRIITPNDPGAIVEAVNYFASSDRSASMRIEARRRFETLYSESANYDRLTAIYREVLAPL